MVVVVLLVKFIRPGPSWLNHAPQARLRKKQSSTHKSHWRTARIDIPYWKEGGDFRNECQRSWASVYGGVTFSALDVKYPGALHRSQAPAPCLLAMMRQESFYLASWSREAYVLTEQCIKVHQAKTRCH